MFLIVFVVRAIWSLFLGFHCVPVEHHVVSCVKPVQSCTVPTWFEDKALGIRVESPFLQYYGKRGKLNPFESCEGKSDDNKK